MKIYDFEDYKKFIQQRVKSMPHGGRGEYQKIAQYLETSSVVLSQIIKGKRDLSLEQGYLLGKYFGFKDLEQEYFQTLLQISRSTHIEHKKYLKEKLIMIRKQSLEIKNITPSEALSDEAKSLFYSHWYYSAVRLSVTIPGVDSVDKISNRLQLSKALVQKIVNFLLAHDLIREEKGRLIRGPTHTFLEADSPFTPRYQASWRAKAVQNMDEPLSHERFLCIPMSTSPETLMVLREKLGELAEFVRTELQKSQPTTLGCLNVDLFELKK